MDERRNVYSMHYIRGYYRQDENPYLALPREMVEQYSPEVQRALGYSVSQPYLGWVEKENEVYDPIVVLGKDGLNSHRLHGLTAP